MIDFEYYESLANDLFGERYSFTIREKRTVSKFGFSTATVSGSNSTVASFQGSTRNETFVSTNAIDRMVSTNAGDTGPVSYVGHTIDASGNLTRVQGVAVLTGQTPAVMSIPCARVERMFRSNGTFASPAVPLVGNIYAYDSSAAGAVTGGTPTNAIATKCAIVAGRQQSTKCALAVAHDEVLLVTWLTASLHKDALGSNVFADFMIEARELGGVWRPFASEIPVGRDSVPIVQNKICPGVIIPPNTDVRVVADPSANSTRVEATLCGLYAKRVP